MSQYVVIQQRNDNVIDNNIERIIQYTAHKSFRVFLSKYSFISNALLTCRLGLYPHTIKL